jgi:hypothetical protein
MFVHSLVIVVALLAANYVSHPGAIMVAHSCPLQVKQVNVELGKGVDRDSLYANFFVLNPTGKEFLYTYKLQLRSANNRSDVREQVASSPILPHTKGWYHEFVGVEFSKPAPYTVQHAIISCVNTGT